MAMKADNPFAFLADAKPANLYRLLEKLPLDDAAMVLANLPPLSTAQVMAYFPDEKQGDLLASMRTARRAGADAQNSTIAKLRNIAGQAAAQAPQQQQQQKPAGVPAPAKPKAEAPTTSPSARTPGKTISSAYGRTPLPQPQPWKPRTTDETPINAPARPNRPPPVSGDPAKSPLAKLNIFDFLGLNKNKTPAETPETRDKAGQADLPPFKLNPLQSILGKKKQDDKQGPREGVVSGKNLKTLKTPRVLGIGKQPPVNPSKNVLPPVKPKAPAGQAPADGPRRMDGMAILAAIMRSATPDVRHNIASDNPELFRQLKKRMFVFDDLLYSENDALAQIFTVAPLEDAALALRFAPPALRDRALKAVSPRRAELLKDSAASGSSHRSGLDDIENAQQRVIDVAMRLQSAGRILIDPDDPDLAL